MSLSQAIDEMVCILFILHLFLFHSTSFFLSKFTVFNECSLLQMNNPSQWNRKMTDAMAKDFSWDAECCDIHVSAYAAIKNL